MLDEGEGKEIGAVDGDVKLAPDFPCERPGHWSFGLIPAQCVLSAENR